MDIFEQARYRMVKKQLKGRDIIDPRVLSAMETIPRHHFLPKEKSNLAYSDQALAIGYEQTISQPYIVALMSQALGLKGNEKVLEIGTGCAYQTAILALLARTVYSIEIVKELYEMAQQNLSDLKEIAMDLSRLRCGNGYQGWSEAAPFDAILVAAAAQEVPITLTEQLKKNGRMVIPIGAIEQKLMLFTKCEDGTLNETYITAVRFVPFVKK